MKGDYRIPKETRELDMVRIIAGIFTVLIGTAFFFLMPDLDFPYWAEIKIIVIFITFIGGVALVAMGTEKSMKQYYVSKNGKCRLAGEDYSCLGDCKKCVFAAAYLEKEMRKDE